MKTNESKPIRRKAQTPELEPAYGELRHDYDGRRVIAELFQMFYFHARPSDVEEYLRSMHDAWLGTESAAAATSEALRRRNAVVNDLCRLIGVVGKNV